MARFDVYTADNDTLLLDVQSDLLNGLNTRVVVPLLLPEKSPSPAKRLNPMVSIEGESRVMATQFLAAIPNAELGHIKANLNDQSDVISSALDMLFLGF